MNHTLHTVQANELPKLREWLRQYLPHSYKIFSTVNETINGTWASTSFVTLGWPDILAVGEGPIPLESPCYKYLTSPWMTSVYSPKQEHFKTLLLSPGFIDWTKPFEMQGIPLEMGYIVAEKARQMGAKVDFEESVMLEAKQGDMPYMTVPERYTVRSLDPTLDTEYVNSTWAYSKEGATEFIREMIRLFPSVGLFDEENRCIAVECGYEYGVVGMLHVRDEFRGQGLAKVISIQFAQKNFDCGRPVVVMVLKDNLTSLKLHAKLGYKEIVNLHWIYYKGLDPPRLTNKL